MPKDKLKQFMCATSAAKPVPAGWAAARPAVHGTR